MKTEEKALRIKSDFVESDLNEYLNQGWKVKQMCAFNQASVAYASILVILEREIK